MRSIRRTLGVTPVLRCGKEQRAHQKSLGKEWWGGERKEEAFFVYFLHYKKKNPLRGTLVPDWLHMTYRYI